MDVFCALTNDDEANILSSMLAKRMGAEKVIAIINRVITSYSIHYTKLYERDSSRPSE